MLIFKSEALSAKQIIQKRCCCSVYGMAARMVVRHRYTARNRTINNKRITIRAAVPYDY